MFSTVKTEPNQAPEPTTTAVTPRADARVAPAAVAAHLYRSADVKEELCEASHSVLHP